MGGRSIGRKRALFDGVAAVIAIAVLLQSMQLLPCIAVDPNLDLHHQYKYREYIVNFAILCRNGQKLDKYSRCRNVYK